MSRGNRDLTRRYFSKKMTKIREDQQNTINQVITTVDKLSNKSYEYGLWEENTAVTEIITENVYVQFSYPNTPWYQIFTTGDMEISNNFGKFLVTYISDENKKYNLTLNFNGYKETGNNGQYQFEMRKNGVKAGPSPRNRFDSENKYDMLTISGIINLNPGDEITFHIRNIGDNKNIFVTGFSIVMVEI